MALNQLVGPAAESTRRTSGQSQTADSNNYLDTALILDVEKDDNFIAQFGSQTMTGFLMANGQEKTTTSDQFEHYEEVRLNAAIGVPSRSAALSVPVQNAAGTAAVSLPLEDASAFGIVRAGSVLLLNDAAGSQLFVVSKGTSPAINVVSMTGATVSVPTGPSSFREMGVLVGKGSDQISGIEPGHSRYRNNVIIVREDYEFTGSDDAAQVWFDITDPATGRRGSYWTYQGEGNTYRKFKNSEEMSLLTSREDANISLVANDARQGIPTANGYFEQVKSGTTFDDFTDASTDRQDFADAILGAYDDIIDDLDAEGQTSMYAQWSSLKHKRVLDDMLRLQDGMVAGGLSYGMFGYDSEKMINFKFKGFNRDGYEFYCSKWDVLNDNSYLGNSAYYQEYSTGVPMSGLFDPETNQPVAGVRIVTKVDKSGSPRKMKHWFTGGASVAKTDASDVIRMHYLTERGIEVLGARNFYQLRG